MHTHRVFVIAAIALAVLRLTHTLLYTTGGTRVWQSTDAGHTWQLNPCSFPGPMLSIAASRVSPTVLFAGSCNWENWGGRVFRSYDDGQTWGSTSTQFVNAWHFAFDPITSATVYAASWTGGARKSSDAGWSWAMANAGLDGRIEDFLTSADAPGSIYAAGSTGVYVSYDAASHWQRLWAGPALSLARDPLRADTLYVGANEGIYASYNAGARWYPAGECAQGAAFARLVFAPSVPDVLWAATDSGLWECRRAAGT